jgi:hypothetical protein
MQRARWYVVVGSLSAGLAFLPLAGISCPPADSARAEQTAAKESAKEPAKTVCEVKLADTGLNAETFKKLTAEEKIKYQLRRKVTLQLEQATVPQLCAELEKLLDINVILDRKSLEEAAFDSATPIDKIFPQPAELRKALRLTLNDLGLSYVTENDVLLVTTKTAQENQPIVKLYPVGEFIRPVGSSPTYDNQDFDSLIQLIQSSIQPTTWKANGGQGDIAPFQYLDLLVISDTQEVHEQLEDLFGELRKIHAGKAEIAASNETALKRIVYPIVLPRAQQTKTTRDKDNQEITEVTPVGDPQFSMEELSALVKKSIEPASWNDERVSIALLGEKLVITQSQATQRKVAEFLHELEVLPWQQSHGPNSNRNTPRGLGGLGGGAGAGCGGPDGARQGGLF